VFHHFVGGLRRPPRWHTVLRYVLGENEHTGNVVCFVAFHVVTFLRSHPSPRNSARGTSVLKTTTQGQARSAPSVHRPRPVVVRLSIIVRNVI